MVYFTSDLHLGHENVIKFQNRPFANVDEMNKVLIDNYNAVVQSSDICYILGDISHHITISKANEYIKKLHGKKFLIKGNHDKNYDESLFAGVYDLCEKSFSIENYNRYFVLMHYPMLSWHRANAGAIHLHGHIHSDGNYNIMNREKHIFRYDVGVDSNNYFPVSIKQIFDYYKDILDDPLKIHGIESSLELDCCRKDKLKKGDIIRTIKDNGYYYGLVINNEYDEEFEQNVLFCYDLDGKFDEKGEFHDYLHIFDDEAEFITESDLNNKQLELYKKLINL